MGIAKSIAHMYSDNQYLYWYIQKGDILHIEQILQKKPNLVQENLTLSSKTTALNRAAYNGNLSLVKLLVQKYQANVNRITDIGQSPLIAATKRNKLEIMKYLISNGADVNFVATSGLSVIQYAILPGNYQAALILYDKIKDKQLRTPAQYSVFAKQYKYRYVNYYIFINQLRDLVPPQSTKDYLTKQKKIYSDPVIDPRQTWGQWFSRTADFKDPPLVERSQLPQQYQPQNRSFGKLRHFITKLTISPLSQVPNYKPTNQSDFQQSKDSLKFDKKHNKLQMQSMQ